MNGDYWLKDVTLDYDYDFNDGRVTGMKSGLFNIHIENGKVAQVISASEPLQNSLPQIDANQMLALPSFVEKHNHLDKTYLGMPWKSCTPVKNLIERLDLEAQELAVLGNTAEYRAKTMLQLLLEKGATHIRTHVNIDPYIGLKNLEGIRAALDAYKDKLSYEIVAFPQHGLLKSDVPALMKRAMNEGATIVGGLDPGGIDENVEGSLEKMMDIAVEANAAVDIHIHDSGHLGYYTIDKIADFTEESGWQHRMAVSHAFALGEVSVEKADYMAGRLSHLGISIMSTVPINRPIPPIPLLNKKGVTVELGCDGFYDSWSPFGTGDMLEKAGRLAERCQWYDAQSLSESLRYITGGKTTLDRQGNKIWPEIGQVANMVFVKASCSAEAVALRAERAAVMFKGNIVWGVLSDYEESKQVNNRV